MDYGIKIAKTGFPVKEAGLNELIYHSSHPLLKIYGIFKATVVYTKDAAGLDILLLTHDFEYAPIIRCIAQWWNVNTSTKETSFRPTPIKDSLASGSVNFTFRPYANDTQIRLNVGSFDGSGVANVSLDFILAVYYDPEEEE